MIHLLLSVLVALVAISIIPTVFSESLRGEFTIPDWVKNTAGWWATEYHIPNLLRRDDVELTSVCKIETDELLFVKEKFGFIIEKWNN